jgi:hypothetical protein
MASTKTRSGRIIKPPERFEPEENLSLEDDFLPDEYDSETSSTVSSDVEYSEEEEEECDDDDDDDENDSFIVESEDGEDSEDDNEEYQPDDDEDDDDEDDEDDDDDLVDEDLETEE